MFETILYIAVRGVTWLFSNVLDVTSLKDMRKLSDEEVLFDQQGLQLYRHRPGKPEQCLRDLRITITTHRILFYELAKPSSSHVLILALYLDEETLPHKLPGVEHGTLRREAVQLDPESSSLFLSPYDLGWKLRNDIVLQVFSDEAKLMARLITHS